MFSYSDPNLSRSVIGRAASIAARSAVAVNVQKLHSLVQANELLNKITIFKSFTKVNAQRH